MVIGECLERATTIDGRRRFYAPGRHPATYRDRMIIERLERIRANRNVTEVIAYHRRRIDDFERGQCLEKARYIEAMTPEPDEATERLVARLREEAGVLF